jgi:uncharacterized membrane protein YadS
VANYYGFEAPLVARLVGLALANLASLPRWLDAGFRVESYIKTAIVLLAATIPFTLIAWAGEVAILQASIVSLVTFGVIFKVATHLGAAIATIRRVRVKRHSPTADAVPISIANA